MVEAGQFKDANTSGLSFVSGGESGSTDSSGQFTYEQGENITFSVGGVTLGTTAGKAVITPLDLVVSSTIDTDEVINLVRFLMLLDEDANPINGISIGSALSTPAASWSSVDFSSASFAADVASIVSDVNTAYANSVTLPTATEAKNHFQYTYGCIAAGVFSGTFSGDDSGSAIIWVDSLLYDPTLLGTFDPQRGVTSGVIFGSGDTTGVWSNFSPSLGFDSDQTIAVGTDTAALVMDGTFTGFDEAAGTWTNGANGNTGTFSVSRVEGDATAVFRINGIFSVFGDDTTVGALAIDIFVDEIVSASYILNDGVVRPLTGSLVAGIISLSGDGYNFTIEFDSDGSDASNDGLIGEVPGIVGDVTLGVDEGSVVGSSCVLNYDATLVGAGFSPAVIPDDDVSNIDYTSATSLAGVYQGSIARTADCTASEDLNYFVIQADGAVVFYDYQGDDCNLDDDCYTKPTAPAYTPSAIRQGSGDTLEATYNGTSGDWLNISFSKGFNWPGTVYSTTETISGSPAAANTEQAFGIKTRDVTQTELENNLCP